MILQTTNNLEINLAMHVRCDESIFKILMILRHNVAETQQTATDYIFVIGTSWEILFTERRFSRTSSLRNILNILISELNDYTTNVNIRWNKKKEKCRKTSIVILEINMKSNFINISPG